jgi:hypothetical protein
MLHSWRARTYARTAARTPAAARLPFRASPMQRSCLALVLVAWGGDKVASQCAHWGHRTPECTEPCTHAHGCYDYACVSLRVHMHHIPQANRCRGAARITACLWLTQMICVRLRLIDRNTRSPTFGGDVGPSLYKGRGSGGVTVHYFGHQA